MKCPVEKDKNKTIGQCQVTVMNEKKVMADKVLALSVLGCAAGFLLAMGLCLCVIAVSSSSFGSAAIVGVIFIIASTYLATLADRSQREIKEFINKPYLDETETKNVDSSAG